MDRLSKSDMDSPLRSAAFVVLLGLAALFGDSTCTTPVQAEAGQNHREPILISGVQEPDEMRVEPFPLTNFVPTAAEQLLADAMKSVGNNKPAALLPALNQILAKYPDFSDGYVMRLGALCEGNDLVAISSDINNALRYLTTSRVGNTSLRALLSMRAKLEHTNRDDGAAIEDLDKAIHADLDKALEFSNSGGVAPEKTASVCVWTEPDLDALVQHFPDDYRAYMFRALYHGFFLFFEKDEKTQRIRSTARSLTSTQRLR